jgi:hypothetical protein
MIVAIAAIEYLGQIAERFFAIRMQRAPVRVSSRSQRFPR